MEIFKPKVIDFETKFSLFEFLGSYIVDRVIDLSSDQGIVRLGLTGGKSILPLYKLLATNYGLTWDRVQTFLTDERYINLDNPESNYYQIKQVFGEDFIKELGEFNYFDTSLPLDITAKNYQEKLEALDGQIFDINLLSPGLDGHIASLFPNTDKLGKQSKMVLETVAPPEYETAKRLSLSSEALLSSNEIILVLIGTKKTDVLSEMLDGTLKIADYPVKMLLAHPNLVIYHTISDS